MRNPKWHRDEIILALDLYFDTHRGSIDARNPKVIALSKLLNELPIHNNHREETFRNPNGVSLKLSNFLSLDPDYTGKGMEASSTLDKQIFLEFYNNRNLLHTISEKIRSVIQIPSLLLAISAIEDEEDEVQVQEGQTLYKLHKFNERKPKIVALKKKDSLKKYGKLCCEVCDFDFHQKYGDLGKGFIECHHKQPLATISLANTAIDDLALVCANCHRMLHRKTSVLTIEELRAELNQHKTPR